MRSTKFNFRFQSYPNTIEEERRERGWAQGTLAERAGVSRTTIGKLEIWAAGGVPSKEEMHIGHNRAAYRGRARGKAGKTIRALRDSGGGICTARKAVRNEGGAGRGNHSGVRACQIYRAENVGRSSQ